MTFKQGDLVILTKAGNPQVQKFVGQICQLAMPSMFHPNSWRMNPELLNDGTPVAWWEGGMRCIDNPGDDEVDEISLRRDVPEGVPA